MRELPPYAVTLGIETVEADGEFLFRMPFGDVVLGRPGYLHGGAIAGLLEIAAIATLLRALDEGASIKPINLSVNFMRGGTDRDTFAGAVVTRLGGRVANVEAHAWQDDRERPIASAQLNLLVRR
jgi:uncharacterized protein (TIGR00369 family)